MTFLFPPVHVATCRIFIVWFSISSYNTSLNYVPIYTVYCKASPTQNGQVEKADTVGRGHGRGRGRGRGHGRGHGHGHEPKLIFQPFCSVGQKLNMVIHWLKLFA